MSQTIGHGSQFEIESAVPGTYTTILGTTGIDFGSNKVDAVDNTDMSVAGNKRTFIGGMENSGDLTVKLNVKPGDSSQAYVYTCKDGALHNMKVVYPGAVRTESFQGLITSVTESIPDDKIPTLTIKIQISGAITIS